MRVELRKKKKKKLHIKQSHFFFHFIYTNITKRRRNIAFARRKSKLRFLWANIYFSTYPTTRSYGLPVSGKRQTASTSHRQRSGGCQDKTQPLYRGNITASPASALEVRIGKDTIENAEVHRVISLDGVSAVQPAEGEQHIGKFSGSYIGVHRKRYIFVY